MSDSVPPPASAEVRRDVASLDIRIVPFEPGLLPLVKNFSARYWQRPTSAGYYDWRYLASASFSHMFLALADQECLGVLFGFRKPYAIGGNRQPCVEIFDWHSLPGLSGSGIGIRLMRAMMRLNMRLIGVGGTPEATKALPSMGWQLAGQAIPFELPLRADALMDGLKRRVPVPLPGAGFALGLASRWFRPSRRSFPGGTVLPVARAGAAVDGLYQGQTGYDVVQEIDHDWLRWLTTGYAAAGSFRHEYFLVDGQVRGWVLTRVYDTPTGREAAIIEIFAPSPSVPLYAWMIAEAATSLSGEDPIVIRARATCPILQAALRANRFRPGTGVPVFTWPKMATMPERWHVTLNHTDACLRPYPMRDFESTQS